MPPAANALIALNYDTRPDLTLTSVGAANLTGSVALARAILEEQQRKQKDDKEKILAIVRARQVEALKAEELDLARAIRRHHEDNQVQNHLLSLHRETDLLNRDHQLFSSAGSVDEEKLRIGAPTRKRLFEGDTLLRNVLQRRQDELTLLSNIRTATRMKEEDEKRFVKIPRDHNMISSAASRLLPMHLDNSVLQLPLSSQASSQSSLQLQSMSMSPALSSSTSSFLEDEATPFLHQRNTAKFNLQDFHNDSSQSILNSIYSSAKSLRSSDNDLLYLRKYHEGVNATGLSMSKLGKTDVNTPITSTDIPSMTRVGMTTNWLRPSKHGVISNSGLMGASVLIEDKCVQEGQHRLSSDSIRIKASENYVGLNDDTNSDPEADQQQKRFNKHQCKQWTLKFHELLAFKERTGHCNVPHGYKENLALAMWVKRQRHQYNLMIEKKTSTLTGERIKLLENIGFVWNCLETAWEQHFRDLCHFVMQTGHCAVPTTYKRNLRLASWVVTQRRQCKLLEDGKQSSMTPKRLEKLRQIGFPVKIKAEGKT
eukprot:CAMPEP_0197187460 /NCGR_PEP_ID=MMETSP1423-20130617/15893_1 /TAXON_ID=476441 /ORGANISM="Pseudo-nitzschia heimii, Strain UNC1101" /LENGTH=540 /DNA_ID=CAMNT_0042639035 /DNA_START=294 /DNA_END=1916 /DNA_ORIENTATION=+